MHTTTSSDSTVIAYDRVGDGPALVLLGGPPTADRSANMPVVEALAPAFTVYNYDRRGRGDSGDNAPYAVDREYDDIAAVVDAAGGSVYAYGTSGGAIVALEAAARGLPLTKLVLWEPPYIIGDSRPRPPADFADELTGLLAADRHGDMVERFFTVSIGMPAEFVASMRATPFWAPMEANAHTLIRDVQMVGDFSLPIDRLGSITTPTLVVDGGAAASPWILQSTRAVGDAMSSARHQTLEGQPHNVDPAAIAAVVTEFLVS